MTIEFGSRFLGQPYFITRINCQPLLVLFSNIPVIKNLLVSFSLYLAPVSLLSFDGRQEPQRRNQEEILSMSWSWMRRASIFFIFYVLGSSMTTHVWFLETLLGPYFFPFFYLVVGPRVYIEETKLTESIPGLGPRCIFLSCFILAQRRWTIWFCSCFFLFFLLDTNRLSPLPMN